MNPTKLVKSLISMNLTICRDYICFTNKIDDINSFHSYDHVDSEIKPFF